MSEPPQTNPIASIGAAAVAYQLAMTEQQNPPASTTTPATTTPAPELPADINMSKPVEAVSSPRNPPPAASTPAMPVEAQQHGAPTRRYLNTKVTASLLEGMKKLAKEQPEDPLRVLSEFLAQKSRELEGT